MKKHRYQVTLTYLADPEGAPRQRPPLQFETSNHDDIFAIVERMRTRPDLSPDDAASFAVGLKLFSEIMLENRENPLFAAFLPHFGEFMKELKKGLKASG